MTYLTVITAHGALGIWDEVVFLSVAAAFVVFMAVTWLRSRGSPDSEPTSVEIDSQNTPRDGAPDRFRLD